MLTSGAFDPIAHEFVASFFPGPLLAQPKTGHMGFGGNRTSGLVKRQVNVLHEPRISCHSTSGGVRANGLRPKRG